jgi:hypothetical protein
MAWKVQNLRLTLFAPSGEAQEMISALQWQDLTGSEPEESQKKGPVAQQEGRFPPGRLVLRKEPGRVDVLLAGYMDEDAEPEAPVPTVGPLEPAAQALRGLAATAFEKLGSSCVRLAVGADMVEPADSTQAAYAILVAHIRSTPFKLENAQEFTYQLNRPRTSQVMTSLVLNRLTRWHASSWRNIRLQVVGGGPTTSIQGDPLYGAVISTDVNTIGTRVEPLPAANLLPLYDELCGLTAEIRDKGDVP